MTGNNLFKLRRYLEKFLLANFRLFGLLFLPKIRSVVESHSLSYKS